MPRNHININPTSPLNTPSISIHENVFPTSAIQPELIQTAAAIPVTSTALDEQDNIVLKELVVESSKSVTNQKSNVVSVIRTPVPAIKYAETDANPFFKTVPNADLPLNEQSQNDDSLGNSLVPLINNTSVNDNSSSLPLLLPVSFEPSIHEDSTSNSSKQAQNYTGPEVFEADNGRPGSALSWTLPVPTLNIGKIKCKTKETREKTKKERKKEKTVEELMNKIKETEAQLPPKAKPGRKSKTSTREDQHEKKKRSLERNRAAAMRCRLKKKKEIDELKDKVKAYEQLNRNLQVNEPINQSVFILFIICRTKSISSTRTCPT